MQSPTPANGNQPQHTFFQHNTLPQKPFDWLVHLDRPAISPIELLHVSCWKPHQLTSVFKDSLADPYQSFNQSPYWLVRDGTSPLNRALEFLETGCRANGVVPGGRIPGKININTIWDPEVFNALCDPQPSNSFTAADVAQIYTWMMTQRTPGGAPGPSDRPFKSLGNGYFQTPSPVYADGNGLNDTLLRDNPAHPLYDANTRPIRLFEIIKKGLNQRGVIQDHPYQRYELLTKIFNQVTTRSNVFAIWVTVGFFEVNDDTTRPEKLGAEIGSAEMRQVRHRMFAIVDRSAELPPLFPGNGLPPVTSRTAVLGPGPATVTPSQLRDANPEASNGNSTWSIQPGMILRVTGPDGRGGVASENVVVTDVAPMAFTATFSRAYPLGFSSITAFCNPGPWTGMCYPQPSRSPTVCFSIIQ
jgi:hypothetical protein